MKRILLLSVALVWCAMAWATGVKALKGTVKCDGEGVAAVIVTDGENFTQTDAKGRFELVSADDNGLIYITVPSGYSVPSKQSVPQFWQQKEEEKRSYDFTLMRKAQDDTHHGLVVIADPQSCN